VSHELSRAGVEHVVLEKDRIGETWRRRWDSFCLVTPNWSVLLPGHPYDGDDPDGFMSREEVVGYLEGYSQGFGAPVQEGIEVTSLRPLCGGFALNTSAGELQARTVVLCTGAYQRPYRPPVAAALPPGLLQIDVGEYRNPEALPPGAVLVVGSGQSGCQLAEELHEAGREVFLSCGRAGWAPRRLGERDLFWWLREAGDLDDLSSSLQSPEARLLGSLQASGHGGGHDLHYRTLQASGVTLLGRFRGTEGRHAVFAADLSESVAWADQRHEQFMDRIRKLVAERGLPRVDAPGVEPFHCEAPERLELRGFGVVVFTGGFRPAYESWVHCPGAFDELGFPIQEDGASDVIKGLYFVGVHFLRKRKSSLLMGVGEDAALVAQKIAAAGASAAG
jgi:putative flavoprotein involved in K+ transport